MNKCENDFVNLYVVRHEQDHTAKHKRQKKKKSEINVFNS